MKQIIIAAIVCLFFTLQVIAQKSEVFIDAGKAIRGYDPVAYFTQGKPTKGNAQFLYTWNGANWNFASQQNLDSFKTNPHKYSPQYGGYCAYGTADGHKAPTDPHSWTIVDGKLYLNYNKAVQQMWNKKQDDYIITADKNWPALKSKE